VKSITIVSRRHIPPYAPSVCSCGGGCPGRYTCNARVQFLLLIGAGGGEGICRANNRSLSMGISRTNGQRGWPVHRWCDLIVSSGGQRSHRTTQAQYTGLTRREQLPSVGGLHLVLPIIWQINRWSAIIPSAAPHTMIQTDQHYGQPVVFKMTTCNDDKLLQLDTYGTIKEVLRNTYLKPVSYVSNNAGCYQWHSHHPSSSEHQPQLLMALSALRCSQPILTVQPATSTIGVIKQTTLLSMTFGSLMSSNRDGIMAHRKQAVPSMSGISARIAQAKQTARQATGTANLSPLELAFYNRLVELNQHPTQHVWTTD